MRRILRLFLISLVFLQVSCAWFSPEESATEPPQIDHNNKIINAEPFKKGGKLLVIPFKAGSEVVADQELDDISLMIVKGVYDALKEQNAPIEVLSASNAYDADFVMKGYVMEIESPSKIKKWVVRDKDIRISVKGKVLDKQSGATLAVFLKSREGKLGKDTYKQLGHLIGQDLGRFLLSQD